MILDVPSGVETSTGMHDQYRYNGVVAISKGQRSAQRRLVALLLLAILAGSHGFASLAAEPASTTVIVVRHAEKVDDDSRDPALSEAGFERTQALADALEHAGLDAAYASQYRRTRLTVAPTAQSAGLAVQIDPIEGDIPGWAQDFAAAVAQDHAGETVLVAGHSNTVPPLVEALCRCAVEPLTEGDHDRLFIVHRAGGENPSLITARYGAE